MRLVKVRSERYAALLANLRELQPRPGGQSALAPIADGVLPATQEVRHCLRSPQLIKNLILGHRDHISRFVITVNHSKMQLSLTNCDVQNPAMANLLDQIAIGERLRRTREALGYNAGEFAKAAGILQSAYSQYETGTRRLTLVQAVKLCDKYSLTLDWLYRDEVSGLPQRLALKLAGSRRAKGGRG